MKAVFEGRKELFKGLAIYDPYDWKAYPVIHLDMGNCDAQTPAVLRKYLARVLNVLAVAHNVYVDIQEDELSASFEAVLRAVAVKSPVVILVDEYDKPILNALMTSEAEAFRDILKGFYSTIKKCESLERFVFVTGVSKFSHVSLFSDLNNLTDITMDARYATMLGYTQEELDSYFVDRIQAVVKAQNLPGDAFKAKLKDWYDGYRFNAKSPNVYNPVSIAKFFENGGEFNNYWFSTGTPSFLMELAKKTDFDFEKVLSNPVPGVAFSAYEIDKIDPLVLLLQTGYLTIKQTTEDFGMTLYQLDFPNLEVATAFNTYLLNCYTPYSREQVDSFVIDLACAVRSGDVNGFMERWKTFLAAIPYDIQLKHEKYYQTIFYTAFCALGYTIQAECRTNNGRIDAVCSCGEWMYLIEFKLDKSAEVALDQIKRNVYYQKYMLSGKRIILIGANFDSATGQLSDWKTGEVKA